MRAFFVSIFTLLGIGLGLVVFFGALGGIGSDEIESKTSYKLLPNASGERKSLGTSDPVILQLNIDGVIGLQDLTTSKMRTLLTESREGVFKDARIKAILLNINSPGGVSFDAMAIYRMLKEYKERYNTPIIAYTDGVCASGSLMIAVAADKIVASEGSIVGSVGVITNTFFNASELIKKYDVQSLTVFKGKNKDMMNPWRPWKEDEAAPVQSLVDYHYDIFVNMMTTNRPGLDKDKLINEYGANVYSAEKAVELGYIDAAGYSYSKALELAVDAAGLQGKEYRVVQLTSKTWVADLFNERFPLMQGKVIHQLQLHPDLHPELMNKFLYLYIPGMTQ